MSLRNVEWLSNEVLVIGGGGAGARAAVEASERSAEVIRVLQGQIERKPPQQ